MTLGTLSDCVLESHTVAAATQLGRASKHRPFISAGGGTQCAKSIGTGGKPAGPGPGASTPTGRSSVNAGRGERSSLQLLVQVLSKQVQKTLKTA